MNEIAFAYFIEVVRLGSIRKAADAMYVSPSSISRMIARLEHDLGTELLVRHSKGIKLTDAGALLNEFAKKRDREWDRLRAQFDASRRLEVGHITIATVEGALSGFLPSFLKSFSQRYPNLTYEIQVCSTDEVMQAVGDDRADVGIAFQPYPRNNVRCVAELRQPVYAIMAPDHPFASREQVTLEELLDQPLGMPDRSFGVRRLVENALKPKHLELKLRMATNSIEMTRQFAIYGMGIALLPAFAIEHEISVGSLVHVPVASRELELARLQICLHAEIEPTAATRQLVAAICERIGAMDGGMVFKDRRIAA